MQILSRENTCIARIRRPARIRRGTALSAMCALALAACGTQPAGESDPKARSGERLEAETTAPAPTESEGADFLPFMELLTSLAEPCVKERKDKERKDADAAEEPADAASAGNEVQLSSLEKCEARIHARRITQALDGTPASTPRQVKQVLRDLGYIDERIHGPQRAGERVEFTLDLRVLGGQLCLSGSVHGTRSVIEPYGAPASDEVGCPDVRRRR